MKSTTTSSCSSESEDVSLLPARLLNLKPLRDLAQNWDVDIASCLQEYLQQLECAGHSINVDLPNQLLDHDSNGNNNSNATTNFAQAAVLLQNSSSVYGRKVEYLHSLVYATLEKLIASSANHSANGKSRNSNSSTSSATKSTSRNDQDVLQFQAYDPDCQFLLLDDILPIDSTGAKINLKSSIIPTANQQLGELNATDDENIQFNTTRLSLGGSLSVTRVETTTPSPTANGQINNKNDPPSAATTAMIMETLFSEGGGGGGGNLRLMNGVCDISFSGALIMPGANCDQSEHQTIDAGQRKGLGTLNNDDRITPLTGERLDLSVEGGPISAPTIGEGGDVCAEGGSGDHFGDYDDHDDNDGVGFVLEPEHDEQRIGTPLASNEQQQITLHQRLAGDEKAQIGIASNTTPSKNNAVVITKQDPWAMLDPHCGEKSKSKPLRVGITYHLPEGLQDTPSNSVTGSYTKRTSMQQPQQESRPQTPSTDERTAVADDAGGDLCLATQAYRATLHASEYESNNNGSRQQKRQRSMVGTFPTSEDESNEPQHSFLLFPSSSSSMTFLSLKHLAYGEEFLYVAKAQNKRKAVERRKLLRLHVEQNAESSDAAKIHEKFNNIYNDDDDDGNGEGEGGPFRFDDGSDNDDNDDHHYEGIDNVSLQPSMETSDYANFDKVFGEGSDNKKNDYANGGDHRAATALTATTFETLCRAHLHEFAKGAEKYAIETQLSKRVKTWQSKLAVILEEEEERPEFNIRTYQQSMLDTAANIVEKKKISKKLASKKNDENSKSDLMEDDQQESNNNIIDFVSLTHNKEPHEVSRIFLSSLMLCNSNNAVFRHTKPDEVATPDELKFEMLSFKFESRIGNYLD